MENKFSFRRSELLRLIPEKLDGALIVSQVNGKYFTDFDCDNGYLLVTRKGCVYITDSRYTEAAQKTITDCEVVEYSDFKKTGAEVISRLNAKSLLIEADRMTISQFAMLSDVFSPAGLTDLESLDDMINSLRTHKDLDEVNLIKAAQAVTEKAFEHVCGLIREGVTEKELALEFEFYSKKMGAERLAFDSIAASGENGSMPHAVPTSRRIRKGDFITFDIGTVVGGYHSDMTRTVALGRVSDEQRLVYETVLKAQQNAIDYLVNGGDDLAECDEAARSVIREAGYGKYFGHSTGHGVGLEIHEFPSVSHRGGKIPVGAVITVEPGIYLPSKFGVRIENMMYKTADSAENLTSLDRKLIEL